MENLLTKSNVAAELNCADKQKNPRDKLNVELNSKHL